MEQNEEYGRDILYVVRTHCDRVIGDVVNGGDDDGESEYPIDCHEVGRLIQYLFVDIGHFVIRLHDFMKQIGRDGDDCQHIEKHDDLEKQTNYRPLPHVEPEKKMKKPRQTKGGKPSNIFLGFKVVMKESVTGSG